MLDIMKLAQRRELYNVKQKLVVGNDYLMMVWKNKNLMTITSSTQTANFKCIRIGSTKEFFST